MHKWTGAWTVALGALLLAGVAGAGGRLSLIDTGGHSGKSVYRKTPFVEVVDESVDQTKEKFEYSVPFVPVQLSRQVAGKQRYSWQKLQDTVKWAQSVGLNNSITATGTPHDLFFANCTLQIPADISIGVVQGVTGKGFLGEDPVKEYISNPFDKDKGWADDGVNLDGILAPRVSRDNYCQYADLNLVPDLLTVYGPGVQVCTQFGCLATPNFPLPTYVDWNTLRARMENATRRAIQGELPTYEKENAQMLASRLPLAIQWDGVVNLHGDRSGTTLAPVIGAESMFRSAADLSRDNPRFGPYLAIVGKHTLNGFPVVIDKHKVGEPGIEALEQIKRNLVPGFLHEQEQFGYASFFETWRSLDTVTDLRPTVYWATALQCWWFACTPVPVPVPMPVTTVTGPTATVLPTPGGPGTTIFESWRYHFAWESIPEGFPFSNVVNSPKLRIDKHD